VRRVTPIAASIASSPQGIREQERNAKGIRRCAGRSRRTLSTARERAPAAEKNYARCPHRGPSNWRACRARWLRPGRANVSMRNGSPEFAALPTRVHAPSGRPSVRSSRRSFGGYFRSQQALACGFTEPGRPTVPRREALSRFGVKETGEWSRSASTSARGRRKRRPHPTPEERKSPVTVEGRRLRRAESAEHARLVAQVSNGTATDGSVHSRVAKTSDEDRLRPFAWARTRGYVCLCRVIG